MNYAMNVEYILVYSMAVIILFCIRIVYIKNIENIHTYIYTYIPAYSTYKHAYKYTFMHTYINTYIHTYFVGVLGG